MTGRSERMVRLEDGSVYLEKRDANNTAGLQGQVSLACRGCAALSCVLMLLTKIIVETWERRMDSKSDVGIECPMLVTGVFLISRCPRALFCCSLSGLRCSFYCQRRDGLPVLSRVP